MTFTDTQVAYARAILLIKRKLEPLCESCGVGADRPNCAQDLGGYCKRHDQENVIEYHNVIRELEKISGLREATTLWETKIPLHLVVNLSTNEKALLQDLYEAPNCTLSSRASDVRYRSLSEKKVCYYMANDKWNVILTPRGEELYNHLKERNEI